jgi:hypothetical protein
MGVLAAAAVVAFGLGALTGVSIVTYYKRARENS